MGFDIHRFVESSVDPEFICNICQDVLEEPLMIANCQHFFCSKCIRDCIRLHGVCPQDRSPVSITQLVEPLRIVKNLLNKLKIKCQFSAEGCNQVLSLGQIHSHYDKCERNPENKKTKCFCKQEFTINEFNEHKDNCLEYKKNELKVLRSQMTTYSQTFYEFSENVSEKVTKDSEIKFLYQRFKQSLPQFSHEFNTIQRSLLYINWKLLNNETETEKDLFSTIRYLKYGFEDLSISLDQNYDNCCDFIALKAFDFIYLCENMFNNKHINEFIARIVKSFSQFDDLLIELMNRKCIQLMVSLMNGNKNDIKTCIDCATVLSTISLLGAQKWKQEIPDLKRPNIHNDMYLNVVKWKLNQKCDISYESFNEIFANLKSNETTVELNGFYVWVLAFMVRNNATKYVPMICTQNGLQFLQNLMNNTSPLSGNSSEFLSRLLESVIDKCNEWQNSVKTR